MRKQGPSLKHQPEPEDAQHHAQPVANSLPRPRGPHSLPRHTQRRRHLRQRLLLALVSLPLLLLLAACDVESLTSTPTPGTGTGTSSTRPQATATATTQRAAATPTVSRATTPGGADTGNGLPIDGLEQAIVERVVDGDTLIVWRDGHADTERLRYIGVDTPESVDPNRPVECYGPEATDVNVDLVAGAVVWLEQDISDTDQYGRLLRYVYVEHNGNLVFVNQELIRQGVATVVTFPPDTRYTAVLRAAQDEARAAGRGLWGACTP